MLLAIILGSNIGINPEIRLWSMLLATINKNIWINAFGYAFGYSFWIQYSSCYWVSIDDMCFWLYLMRILGSRLESMLLAISNENIWIKAWINAFGY